MADRVLIEQARHGDRQAFEHLAEQVADRLFQVAYRIVRDMDRAQDAVQQTLIAIWCDLPTLRDVERFDAWCYRLVVRFALADARRARRTGMRFIPLTIEQPASDELERVAVRDQLERAFRGLSADHRAVVVLCHYMGLPIGEAAGVLGVPAGTVASRLHRAKAQLRAALDADARTVVGKALA